MNKTLASNVSGTFVSEKINKVRWVIEEYTESNSFVTGSWDSEENHLKLWTNKCNDEDSELTPAVDAVVNFMGDVTELQFVKTVTDSFIASSSRGFVKQYRISRAFDVPSLVEELSWDNLHFWENSMGCAPCTALDVFETDFVTVGEDGRLNLLTYGQKQVIRTIDDADSCTFKCVRFVRHNEVLTGNLRGQMKLWDLRSGGCSPSGTFMSNGEQAAATCITHHPTQRHIVLVGNEEGSVTVWDLRLPTYPVSLLSAHSDAVSEIKFHPDHSSRLFTCSNSGELWHWDAEKLDADSTAWLSSESSKQKLQVYSLIPSLHKPVNSLDVVKDKAICGCDNEAIYQIFNLYM